MATVEFQLSTQAFLKAQRNALLQRMACPPAPFAITRADGTALLNVVIDRIELGAAALDHNQEEEFAIFGTGSGSESGDIVFKDNAKGFKVQMTQELTVHVTTLEDILSRPDQPPAIVVPVSGKLVFDISAFAGPDGLIYMRIDFDQTGSSITVPPGGSGIPVDWDKVNGAVMAELDSRLPSLTIPIGLQDLAQGSKFINAGASVDSTGSRLAIRGDTALHIPPAMLFVWDAFHKGNFDDRLDGNEWALFVDGKFLGAIIDAKIDGGLMELPSEVEVLPRTTYSNVGGKAVFSVGLDINVDPGGIAGDVLDALPGLVGNGHMELQLPVELKLGSPTDLVAEVDMTTIQAQATPFLGIVGMMIDFWGVSLQGFLDFAARSILSGEEKAAKICEVTPEHSIRCTLPITPPSTGGMSFGIISLVPHESGFSLNGNLRMLALTPAVLDIGVRQLRLEPPTVDCSVASMAMIAAFSSNSRAWKIVHGEIMITNMGTAPLMLCDYQVVGNDWARAFPRTALSPDSSIAPITIYASFAAPKDSYYAGDGPGRPANYPCIVLLRTSAGTRAVSLGHAPVVTQEKLDSIKAELLAKVAACKILTDNWWDGDHAHNPDWHIPDPPDLRPGHHWQFDVDGLRPGDAAALLDRDGNQIVSVLAQSGATVRLSTVVQPISGRKDVSLVKIAARNVQRAGGGVGAASVRSMMAADAEAKGKPGPEEPPTRGISTFQQSLLPIGSVRLEAPCIEVVPSRRAGSRTFVAVMPGSVAAFDLTHPLQPMMVGHWRFDGARGAVPWQGGVLAFGDDGFAMVDGDGLQRIDNGRCDVFRVLSAAATENGLYALTDDGVELLDAQLRRLRKVDMKDGRRPRSIVAAGNCMAMGCSDGILTLPKDGRHDPKRLVSRSKLRVLRLSRPSMRVSGMGLLAELEDGSARLLDVDDNQVEEAASYAETPWFAHAARLGSLLAHWVKDANRLKFYRLGPSDRR